jgi:hypothetical protein
MERANSRQSRKTNPESEPCHSPATTLDPSAKSSGLVESFKAVELVEDGLRMNPGVRDCQNIKSRRDFAKVQPVLTDKNKGLQNLVNLIRNPKSNP